MFMQTHLSPVDLEKNRQQSRIDLAAAYRQAVLDGLHEGISNHFTFNVPGITDRFYLNPYGMHWSEVRASELLEVGFDGQIVAGRGIADETAVCIHGPIHRLNRNAACVMHTHMPYCTALTQLEDMSLEMTGQVALFFDGKVAYDYHYAGFADSLEEGERLVEVMGDKPILMLANHGVIVTGRTVASTYYRLYYLERACRTQLFSMWTGRRRGVIRDEVRATMQRQLGMSNPAMKMSPSDYLFAALKRGLDRTQPDYAS
jgi:ribulose-5-phosphate 4-epimerase/fuculose-1-phosphate aldolase